MNHKELPVDRLSTSDKDGNRIYLYPSDVRGHYRNLRSRLNVFLILIFLLLPWVKIGGHQAVLLDIANRRFAIGGITFWAHDAPMLLFIFGGGILLLSFITAIWGRVWCGWACPQTVFVDGVFRKIERWIEGDSLAQRKLDESKMNFEKFAKKSAKWSAFTALTLIISHSFLAYFYGTEELAKMISRPPTENLLSFLVMLFITGWILFDFGWFREQFCTVVCPYGRFQSVLMDDRSKVVAYDVDRGEPRRSKEISPGEKSGDCVNCYRCVQVCPTGIDIRRGVQLECIACTACMDACDDVMSRLNKPKGLIRYATQEIIKNPSTFRPRVWFNGALLLLFTLGLTYTLYNRNEIEVTIVRAVDTPYQVIQSENGSTEIINHFKIDSQNQSFESKKINFEVSQNFKDKQIKLVTSNHQEIVAPGATDRADLFIRFPKSLLSAGNAKIQIDVAERKNLEIHLVGPFN